MSLITIDGVDLPAPSKFRIRKNDLVDINTNELGIDQVDKIRSGKQIIELIFLEMNNSQLQLIDSATTSTLLSVKYPTAGGFKISNMRIDGEKDIEMVLTRGRNIRWNISFNLIEY